MMTIKSEKIQNEEEIYQKNAQRHMDIVARIQNKQDALFRVMDMAQPNPVFQDKIERFKKDNLEHYSKVFGNITIGVHGKELPKFQEHAKEYWQHKRSYNPSPSYQSAKFMKEDRNVFKVRLHTNMIDLLTDKNRRNRCSSKLGSI